MSLLEGLLPGFLGLLLTLLSLLLNRSGLTTVSGDDVILRRDFAFALALMLFGQDARLVAYVLFFFGLSCRALIGQREAEKLPAFFGGERVAAVRGPGAHAVLPRLGVIGPVPRQLQLVERIFCEGREGLFFFCERLVDIFQGIGAHGFLLHTILLVDEIVDGV